MKIAICGSMSHAKEILGTSKALKMLGHTCVLPVGVWKFRDLGYSDNETGESVANKIHGDLIRDYFKKIKESDAVLIVNHKKNNVEGYIGGNSFLELAFGHVLNKKVFVLNKLPAESSYLDELRAMQPLELNGDLSLIK